MKRSIFTERPLSDSNFKLAMAIRRATAKHGSLAAFFKHLARQQEERDRKLSRAQREMLDAVGQPAQS